jgi:hypothetical protein
MKTITPRLRPPTIEVIRFMEQEEFKFFAGHRLMGRGRLVPDRAGVYVIFVQGGDALLDAMDYERLGGAPPWRFRDYVHLYTGAGCDMRDRLLSHMFRDARVSSFRKSLLAAEQAYGAISSTGLTLPKAPNQEIALDLWLAHHAYVGIHRCADYLEVERRVLKSTPSPLNIQQRSTPFSLRLHAIRAVFDERVPRAFCREFQ